MSKRSHWHTIAWPLTRLCLPTPDHSHRSLTQWFRWLETFPSRHPTSPPSGSHHHPQRAHIPCNTSCPPISGSDPTRSHTNSQNYAQEDTAGLLLQEHCPSTPASRPTRALALSASCAPASRPCSGTKPHRHLRNTQIGNLHPPLFAASL